MALPSVSTSLFFLLSFTLLASTTSSSHLKSLHFSLYQQDTINKTAYYVIVSGVAGPNISQTAAPFGTFLVFHDPMTVTADPTSRVLGTVEGTSLTSSLDGLRSISVMKFTLNVKNHRGSVSIVGGAHNLKPADYPVVGGTGDFLFVQGYLTSSPVDLVGPTIAYKTEFHLYWPPYASKATH